MWNDAGPDKGFITELAALYYDASQVMVSHRGIRAVVKRLAEVGRSDLDAILPAPEDIAAVWDTATVDPELDLGRAAAVLDVVRARVGAAIGAMAAKIMAVEAERDEARALVTEGARREAYRCTNLQAARRETERDLVAERNRADAAEATLARVTVEARKGPSRASGRTFLEEHGPMGDLDIFMAGAEQALVLIRSCVAIAPKDST